MGPASVDTSAAIVRFAGTIFRSKIDFFEFDQIDLKSAHENPTKATEFIL